jgi:hypothetical protein
MELLKAKKEVMAKTEASIEDNNDKFEVLQGTAVSRIDANKAKADANLEEVELERIADREHNKEIMKAN